MVTIRMASLFCRIAIEYLYTPPIENPAGLYTPDEQFKDFQNQEI